MFSGNPTPDPLLDMWYVRDSYSGSRVLMESGKVKEAIREEGINIKQGSVNYSSSLLMTRTPGFLSFKVRLLKPGFHGSFEE